MCSIQELAETREQAEVRWGLGLARVQQALLFVARTLRQKGDSAEERITFS